MAALTVLVCACNMDIETVETVPQKGTTIWAGFEDEPDTKTALSVSGSKGKVLWKSGDSFELWSMAGEDGFYDKHVFSTTQDNVSKAEFSTSSSLYSAAAFYSAFYPTTENAYIVANNSYFDGYTTYKGFRVVLPESQTAVAGSFDPAASLLYAYSSTYEGTNSLQFKNMVSLLKIRLTGSKVGNLQAVKVTCNDDPIAGDSILYDYDTDPNIIPIGPIAKNAITLAGSFTADTDYYIAIAPGTYSGISLNFIFDDSNIITRSHIGSVTFSRSQAKNLGTFELNSTEDDDVMVYAGTTPEANHATICVIPDGFTTSERSDFITRANAAMDYLFSVEPYKVLKNMIKVYFIWTPSEESGASITDGGGNVTTAKNTAFGSRWGASSYSDMTADDATVYGFVSARCPEIVLGEKTISEVPILMLINDERYGGIAHTVSDGRVYCQVPYTNAGGPLSWDFPDSVPKSNNPDDGTVTMTPEERDALVATLGASTGDWRNVVVHEFGGHSFGRLKDEYWYDTYYSAQCDVSGHEWTVPYGLNVSGWYDQSKFPDYWQTLLANKEALVTKNALYNRIGVYQGGDVSMFNRWRSEEISCMIDNRPYFSTLQRVLIADRIYTLAGYSFSLNNYLNNYDNPEDPVRDIISSPVMQPATKGAIPVMPMLPPPIMTVVEP